MLGVGFPLTFAALFYAAAEYEHMTGWKWAAASIVVSLIVRVLFSGSFVFALPAQLGLFGVLWWQNSKRLDALNVDRAARLEEDRRVRKERVRHAQEQADRGKERKQ